MALGRRRMINLSVATNETIDQFIVEASRLFFDGSQQTARSSVGEFDADCKTFILAYEHGEPIATVTVISESDYPLFVKPGSRSFRTSRCATIFMAADSVHVSWMLLRS